MSHSTNIKSCTCKNYFNVNERISYLILQSPRAEPPSMIYVQVQICSKWKISFLVLLWGKVHPLRGMDSAESGIYLLFYYMTHDVTRVPGVPHHLSNTAARATTA